MVYSEAVCLITLSRKVASLNDRAVSLKVINDCSH
jgi:hypothetical protein